MYILYIMVNLETMKYTFKAGKKMPIYEFKNSIAAYI